MFQEAAAGRLDLQSTLPLLIHGDEGRGRRHAAHFVLSFHSMLGFGFSKDGCSRKKNGAEWNVISKGIRLQTGS